MLWKFVKNHWFIVALALLVLAALVRKNGRTLFGKSVQPEKYTRQADTAGATALMGIFPKSNGATCELPAIRQEIAVAFLKRFGSVAAAEQKKYGVPASILLGMAYVNSFAGQRATAQTAKNYFALPCSPDWDGATAEVDGKCFRRYETAWESFRDESLYLRSSPWLETAKQQCGQDWRAWVAFLADQPVSDVRDFEKSLKSVIEAYRLFELDGQ